MAVAASTRLTEIGVCYGRCSSIEYSRLFPFLLGDFIAFNSRNVNAPPSEANCRTVLNNVIGRCSAVSLPEFLIEVTRSLITVAREVLVLLVPMLLLSRWTLTPAAALNSFRLVLRTAKVSEFRK